MIALARLWGWWTDTWCEPRRARVLYVAMALAFAALAIAAAVSGDTLVAALAGVAMLVTIALAALAPRLSKLSGSPLAEQGDPWKRN
jgi:hypothetical protein